MIRALERAVGALMLVTAAGLLLHQVLYANADGLTATADRAALPDDVRAELVRAEDVFSGATATGAELAIGRFTGGSSAIGIESGMVLSTGNAAQVAGPNLWDGVTTSFSTEGDASLDGETHDATVLEFSFIPGGDSVTFKYVFATEEAIGADPFSIRIDGTDCATVPALAEGGGGTEMDYVSAVQTCVVAVTPGAVNHARFAIADAGDTLIDSALFVSLSH